MIVSLFNQCKHHQVICKSHMLRFATKAHWKRIKPSIKSIQTINPIRKLFDHISDYKIAQNKELISVAIGDPVKYLDPPSSIKAAILNTYTAPNIINGYCNSNGLESARIAISKQYTDCDPNDVIITGGCQQALDISFYSLLNDENGNVLLPEPCWPEYATNLNKYGFGYKYYKCIPHKQWQIDASHLESVIDNNTKAILTNSPSNPCGSVLNYESMCDILKIAEKYNIPIISDEIYSKIIFPTEENNQFISYSTIKQKENISVPVIITSGFAKNYLIPGWKVGYIVLNDENNSLEHVRKGMSQLMQVNYGPASICQHMICDILEKTEPQFWIDLNNKLYEQSELFCNLINDPDMNHCFELEAIPGKGSFYVMVKIHFDKLKDIDDDYKFFEKLLAEQAVFILPGSIFKMDGYFRAVICPPKNVLEEVCRRLSSFCSDHRKR